jgi:Family of unknown function (DUF5947)
MTAGPQVGELRRFLTPRPGPAEPSVPVERCDLCGTEVAAEHPHLVHIVERSLKCACRPCALLFRDRPADAPAGSFSGFRTIPDRYLRDPDFVLTDQQWDALQIPVGMAFFLLGSRTTGSSVLACYPSPAGATESELDLAHWSEGVGAGRLAALLEPDVEALLVRRGTGHDAASATRCVLVPVDACYRLVGLVRRHWRGFDGGADAWGHIDAFFDAVEARSREVPR